MLEEERQEAETLPHEACVRSLARRRVAEITTARRQHCLSVYAVVVGSHINRLSHCLRRHRVGEKDSQRAAQLPFMQCAWDT